MSLSCSVFPPVRILTQAFNQVHGVRISFVFFFVPDLIFLQLTFPLSPSCNTLLSCISPTTPIASAPNLNYNSVIHVHID